jgi:hypothetical protein
MNVGKHGDRSNHMTTLPLSPAARHPSRCRRNSSFGTVRGGIRPT